ncbi:hypothetical protein ACLOJK_010053 [Asimina triloba]
MTHDQSMVSGIPEAGGGGGDECRSGCTSWMASETSHHLQEDAHDGLSFSQFMVAGSVAGMVEHMAMFPVDTLKTRMQMLGASTTVAAATASSSSTPFARFLVSIMRTDGPFRFLASIMRTEGPLGLYRGIGAMGLGAGPAHAVYFSVYETFKQRLGGNRPGHHPLVHAASGVVATIASDAVLTPMDVVKQRLQLRHTPYAGVKDCVLRMLREEGLRAFYASYRTTVVMNAPFTAVHFATYEAAKKILSSITPDKASEENLLVHISAGGAAGTLASAVTNPLDVVKTRLQCQYDCDLAKLLVFEDACLKKIQNFNDVW